MLYLGLVIAGGTPSESFGKTVEVFVPSTGQHCQLPDLPIRRYHHSMEEKTVCGGAPDPGTTTSCLTLNEDGTWETTTNLREER